MLANRVLAPLSILALLRTISEIIGNPPTKAERVFPTPTASRSRSWLVFLRQGSIWSMALALKRDSRLPINANINMYFSAMVVPNNMLLMLRAPIWLNMMVGLAASLCMLGGALLGCVLMALMMANAGGAWDNAKKYVEKGNLGGKGSDTHSAVVVGDTVGAPFKDTSGPAMNILINVMAIVSLVIAPLL